MRFPDKREKRGQYSLDPNSLQTSGDICCFNIVGEPNGPALRFSESSISEGMPVLVVTFNEEKEEWHGKPATVQRFNAPNRAWKVVLDVPGKLLHYSGSAVLDAHQRLVGMACSGEHGADGQEIMWFMPKEDIQRWINDTSASTGSSISLTGSSASLTHSTS
eukprot:Mycagemm_TRINITY_DN11198_c0_g1::TRINITY_DN11198_c0_g1_i1::g.4502::m.4502 type:complete len:162 gc:universal TRINITY_DN11198_c0_g1_i1:306-791(+)